MRDEWREWAARQIEERYGASPSEEDRSIRLGLYADPVNPAADYVTTTAGLGIHRRSWAQRKRDDLDAIGQPSAALGHGSALTNGLAFFELFPQRSWPWLPLLVVAIATVAVATATVLITVAVT